MDLSSKTVIVANNSYQMIGKISGEKAICLLHLGKAISIKDSDKIIRSVNRDIPLPAVIIVPNAKYVKREKVGFNKGTLFERDNFACVYCGKTGVKLNVDHVIPRDKWAYESRKRKLSFELTSYENCVSSCYDCNQYKGNKLLSELGWEEIYPRKPLATIDIDWNTLMA